VSAVLALVAIVAVQWVYIVGLHAQREQERDRTRRAQEEAALADHDALTGLLGRAAWMRAFAARQTRGVLLFCDVNDFKSVNDAHGHLVGDQVLRETARLLRRVLGPVPLIGRYGGDELVAFLPSPVDISAEALEALCARLAAPFTVAGITLSLSVGGVTAQPGSDLDQLLRQADFAMLRYKRERRSAGRQTPSRSR